MLQLPIEQARSNSQLALPGPPPADAQALAALAARGAARMAAPATSVRVEPAKPVALARGSPRAGHDGRGHEQARARDAGAGPAATAIDAVPSAASAPSTLMQPEHWTISFGGPKDIVQAEYWAGNRSVSVRRTANGVIGTLANLHKGIGMPVAWILLVDTLAGSLVLLSLSGLALWMLTRRSRAVGLAILGTALAVTAGLALSG